MIIFLLGSHVFEQTTSWLEFLLGISVKGAMILMAAGILSFTLRRASSAARHLVWNLALCGLLALPIIAMVLPSWHAPILPAEHIEEASTASISASTAEMPIKGNSAQPPVHKFSEIVESQSGKSEVDPAGFVIESLGWPAWVVMIWFAGVLAVMLRLLIGTANIWWMLKRAGEINDEGWSYQAENLAKHLHLTRHVKLLRSDRVTMPLTWGLLNPVILLPADADDWTVERRHVVLLHELAHIKRKDCLTQMLAQMACALHWFNPLVWVAARQMRMERERACDDYVLGTGTKASDYAGHLLEIARAFGESNCSSLATVAIARRSQLEGRLLAILDPKLSRRGLNPFASLMVAVAIACLVLPLATLQPVARAQKSESAQPMKPDAPNGLKAESETIVGSVGAIENSPEPVDQIKTGEEEIGLAHEQAAVAPDGEVEPGPQVSGLAAEQEPEAATTRDRSRIVVTLREALKDEDEGVRKHALFALGQIGDSSAVNVLIEALKDEDWQVRKQAAESLGMVGRQSAVEPLIAALQDRHPLVRERVAWALGMRGDHRATEPLTAALKDENAQVRVQAAWALGMRGTRQAVDALSQALKDEHAQVRAKAAWALGMRGDSSGTDALIEALKDSNAQVRDQAAWALGMKGDRRAIDALIIALKDESAQVRASAAWAIGMKGNGRAAEALKDALKDPNTNVRQKVAWALGMVLMRN